MLILRELSLRRCNVFFVVLMIILGCGGITDFSHVEMLINRVDTFLILLLVVL